MKVEENKYYYCKGSFGPFIFKSWGTLKPTISLKGRAYSQYDWSFWRNAHYNGENLRAATQDEIDWLDACIVAGRYIDKPEKEFKLPENWCVKVEANGKPSIVADWRTKGNYFEIWKDPGYIRKDKYFYSKLGKKSTEITLDQFKKYVLKEDEPQFEFNRWYKDPTSKWMCFIKSESEGYGFDASNKWFNLGGEGWWDDVTLEHPLATDEEVKERLLEYAKEKYSKGDYYKCLVNKDKCEIRFDDIQFTYKLDGIVDSEIGYIFDEGKWAEIVGSKELNTKQSNYEEIREDIAYKPNPSIIPDAKPSELKVGDWVKIIQKYTSYEGEVFELTKENFTPIPDTNYFKIDHKGLYWSYPDQVRIATLEEVEKVKDKISVELNYEKSWEVLTSHPASEKWIGFAHGSSKPEIKSIIPEPEMVPIVDKSKYFPQVDNKYL